MGSLLGDALFGGKSRFDRKQIKDVYRTLGPEAESAISSGESATGDALAYFRGLRSGNPALTAEAIAPATNATSQQLQQQRQALSTEGTARGGGVNAALQGSQDAATKAAVDAITTLAPKAAGEEAQIGGAQAGRGISAASDLGSLAESERRTNLEHQNQEGTALASAIAAFLPTGGGAAGAAGGAGFSAGAAPELNIPAAQGEIPLIS